MAIKTYDASPYFDDFNTSKLEDKNYLRILFKPGVSVQVRELNQMQSMLQSQIDKFGKSVYKDGPVLDGSTYFTDIVNYIDVDIAASAIAVNTNIDLVVGKNIRIKDTVLGQALSAEVYATENISTVGNQRWRLYLRYNSSGANQSGNTNTSEFSDTGDEASRTVVFDLALITTPGGINILGAGASLGVIAANTGVGYASEFTTDIGVFFSRGTFLYNDTISRLFIEKPTKDTKITGSVAFRLDEVIKTTSEDTSLFDNAAGTPNDRAPGGDRYSVDLVQVLLIDDSAITNISQNTSKCALSTSGTTAVNYINLLEVVLSQYIQTAKPEYSQLDEKLATRTFEESGNYTVSPFIARRREFRNDELGNDGLYNDTQIQALNITTENPDVASGLNGQTINTQSEAQTFGESRYALSVEPGVSYVKGYRVELENTLNLFADKSREFENGVESFGQAKLGNYIELSAIANIPDYQNPSNTYEFKNTGGASNNPVVTCRIRGIEYTGALYRLYIYDLSGEIPRTALTITGSAIHTGQTFTGTLQESNTSNPTPIFDTGNNQSIISLPYNTIKGITTGGTSSEVVIRAAAKDISLSSNVIQITSAAISGKTNSRFFNDSVDSYIVTNQDGDARIPVTGVAFSASNGTVDLTLSSVATATVDVIAPVKVSLDDSNGLKRGIKSIATITGEELVASGGTVAQNASFNLAKRDIIDIVSVTSVDGSPVTDLSANIELDNGQRDGVYKLGSVKYTGAQITTGLKITYRYYNRTTAGDYYSVESYIDGSVPYASIGKYKGEYLTDVLDFRPDDNQTTDHKSLDPNAATKITLDYYKSRFDQLVVNTTGEYKIIKGDSAIEPVIPSIPDNTMTLYSLYIPAYTRSADDIQTRLVDNRRFTMEDIGRLEKRVQNVEYYTSLSLLEREANGKQIIDSGGTSERFKNGIIVDSFLTQGVADVLDPGYAASIDLKKGILRPKYSLNQHRLKYAQKGGIGLLGNSNQDNALLNANRGDGKGSLLSLPFTNEKLIHQPTASIDISVNPFDLASWNGAIEMSPSSDEWIQVERRPKDIINIEGSIDAIANVFNGHEAFTTVYDSTETIVTGRLKSSSKVIFGIGTSAAKTAAGFTGGRPVRQTTTTFKTETIKEGYKREAVVNTVETSMGDKVLDVSFIPFIRSRRVYFKAQMLKPNTKVFAFFDGVDVSAYCSKATFKTYGIDNEEVDESTFDKEAAAAFAALPTADQTRVELISDAQGDLEGFLIVPNNQALQFLTGARVFKITDSSTNDLANTTTSASVTYIARGLLQTKQEQAVSTRELEMVSTGERIKELVPGITTKVKAAYYDPLAQSFIIGNVPTGCYTTQIDLFFKAKSTNVPLNVHLVTVENGQPTQKVIPFSRVVKKAQTTLVYETGDGTTTANPAADDVAIAGVAVSDKARLATRFKFESPVYLAPGVEYAIVVMSNSPDYRLWLSETGGDDTITGSRISKNTYAGVSFKSQNASTWTPDQNKDFKMTIWRAKFSNLSGFTYRLDPLGIGGSNPNMTFNNLRFLSQDLTFSNTDINYRIGIGSSDFNTTRNGRLYFNSLQTVTGAGTTSGLLHVDAEFTSESDFVSPVIDLDRVSLVTENNVIGTLSSLTTSSLDDPQTDTELLPGHGSALSRYITREVELNNASDQVNIIINATKPNDQSEIKVYIRVKTGDAPISTIAFDEIISSSVIPVSSSGIFGEVEYIYGGDGVVEPFSAFQVKIVFTAENTASAPMVKDFRAIATI